MCVVGIGTIVNATLVFFGGVVGLLLKNGLRESVKKSLMDILGIVVLFIGLAGSLEGLIIVENGSLKATNTMAMIVCIFAGTIIGEMMAIEDKTEKLGVYIRDKFSSEGSDINFVEGFVSITLLMCLGAMSIIGAFKDALELDPTILYAKGTVDMVACIIFASVFGVGVLFSVIPLAIYQGLLTALAFVLKPFITDKMLFNISYIVSILIFALGINLLFDKKIRVSNMLPSVVLAGIYGIF